MIPLSREWLRKCADISSPIRRRYSVALVRQSLEHEAERHRRARRMVEKALITAGKMPWCAGCQCYHHKTATCIGR